MIAILILLFSASASYPQEKLIVVTDIWPPFSELRDEGLRGKSTKIVKEALALADIPYELWTVPWARAYQMARTKKNVIIFTIVKTETRKPLFQWVSEIHPPSSTYLYSYDQRRDNIDTFEKAKETSISSTRESMAAQALFIKGHSSAKNMTLTVDAISAIRMAQLGRTKFVAAAEDTVNYYMKQHPKTRNKFHKGLYLLHNEYYVAASLQTSDEIIEKLKSAIRTIAPYTSNHEDKFNN